jgi:hypothetical protein
MVHVQFTVTRAHLVALFVLLIMAVVLIPGVARGGDRFTDVGDDNIFDADIAWMTDEDVTKGCNPPINDKYCPSDTVTREQMGAFMHRLYTNKIAPLETADTSVTSSVATLEAQVDALEVLLAGVTRNGETLLLSGMNLQVVNGQGTTASSNGLGNVIIGYNEDNGSTETRTGSHYLIIGEEHDWSSYSGIVAGYGNSATGIYASVTGGQYNTASSFGASVTGGQYNTASGGVSSVTGGRDNTASDSASSVTGGRDNTASGFGASVSGGRYNTASGFVASILGGNTQTVNTSYGCWPAC